MSTISKALDKQKRQQTASAAALLEKPSNSHNWKAALFVSLLVIISLLLVVIYLLFVPVSQPKIIEVIKPAPVESVQKSPSLTEVKKSQELNVQKIAFTVSPLPKPTPPLTEDKQPISFSSEENNNFAFEEKKISQPVAIAVTKEVTPEEIEIDYSATSADLQQRFQLALLAPIDEEAPVKSEGGVASDISEMNRDFQAQLPNFSYDSHLYSSVAKDRWIRINSEDLREGEFDSSGKLQVVEIMPNQTIFRLGRQSFSVQSLMDWKGY